MLIRNLIYCLFFVCLISCTQKKNGGETSAADEQRSMPQINEPAAIQTDSITPVHFTYRQVSNDRYHFTVDIPDAWKVKDKSANGDGFYIETGGAGIDCRIYGAEITGIDDIDNAGIDCSTTSVFTFKDKTKGTQCSDNNMLYYFYTADKKRVTLYINAPEAWKTKNKDAITHVAQSISMKDPA